MKLSWTVILGLALLPLWLTAADSAFPKAQAEYQPNPTKDGAAAHRR